MSEPLTALHMLKLLIPAILHWKRDALLVGILLNNYPEGLAINGRDLHWQFIMYSPTARKEGIFQLDREPLVERAHDDIKSNKDQFLILEQLDNLNLKDSDWLAQKAVELGLPFNEQGQLKVGCSGGADISLRQKTWSLYYKISDEAYIYSWVLKFDMINSSILSHRCVETKNIPI